MTDQTWKPETYRLAKRAWELNAPGSDGKIQGRKAQKSDKPKHAGLSRKLRALMTWRAMMAGSDWTLMADNDNDDSGRTITMNADCVMEIRPLPSEIMAAINRADIQIIDRNQAKLGGGGDIIRHVVGNDVERGKVWRQGKGKPDCIVRIGSIRFSNGGNTDRDLVLDATGRPRMGDVRLPLGAMIKIGPHRLRDYFRHPKGASESANDNNPTVRPSLTARAPAIDFTDPLSDAQERERIRQSVGKETAKLLDHALIASSFEEIGERLGYCGKTAERRGKAALIAACEILERELAA